MCRSAVAASTTPLLPPTQRSQDQGQSTEDSNLQLKSLSSLSSHLDLLTAGSLFLLPSILPYLASGLAYTSSSSLSSSNDWTWGTTWIMILPCIGLVIPMTAACVIRSIQTSPSVAGLQSRDSRCPWTRWSASQSSTYISSWYTCPTIQALQRSWWAVRGRPSGYGPLTQDPLSAPPSPKLASSSPLKGGPCAHAINSKESMLKRPRIVLLSSLCFWTLLMVLSSMGGLNTIRPMVSSPTQNNDSLQIQPVPPSPSEFSAVPYGDDLLLWEPSSIVVEVDPLPVVYPEGFTMAEDVEDDAEVVPEPFEMVVVRPELVVVGSSTLEEFLEVTNSIEPMAAASENEEKRSALASSPPPSPAWVKRDFEDEQEETPVDDMEAMTLDPEDATVFRDFLLSLEAEEQARHVFEDNSEERRKVLQATEDLIVDSIFENEIPCRNTGRTGLLAPFTSTESSHVFEYRAGWTDLMIVAIAMSLGGVLVGLAQARVLAKELQQQQLANSCRPGYLSIFSCMLLSSSALGLTMLMIFGECWDTPSVYFTGIGVAGIILVQAWVPDQAIGSVSCLPLVTPDSDDFVNVSCLNNGDDAGEDAFVDEKFQVQVVSNSELLTVAERRNACSLDESRRWEVTSCCRSDSC